MQSYKYFRSFKRRHIEFPDFECMLNIVNNSDKLKDLKDVEVAV